MNSKLVKTSQGAISYNTTGDLYQDQLLRISINTSPKVLKNVYNNLKKNGKVIDFMFNVRCPKTGLGLRLPFYRLFSFYIHDLLTFETASQFKFNSKTIRELNEKIVNKYGNWKDLLQILETYISLYNNYPELFEFSKETFTENYNKLEVIYIGFIYETLEKDLQTCNYYEQYNIVGFWNGTNCAKWMPRENSQFDKSLNFVYKFLKYSYWTRKKYRQNISKICKYLDLWENTSKELLENISNLENDYSFDLKELNENCTNSKNKESLIRLLTGYTPDVILNHFDDIYKIAKANDIHLTNIYKHKSFEKILPKQIIHAYVLCNALESSPEKVCNNFLETLWFNKLVYRFTENKLNNNDKFMFRNLNTFDNNLLCVDLNSLLNDMYNYMDNILYFLSITYSNTFLIFSDHVRFITLNEKTLCGRIYELNKIMIGIKNDYKKYFNNFSYNVISNPQMIFDYYIERYIEKFESNENFEKFENFEKCNNNDCFKTYDFIKDFPNTFVILSNENFTKPINDKNYLNEFNNCNHNQLFKMYSATLNNFTHIEHIHAKLRRLGLSKNIIFWKINNEFYESYNSENSEISENSNVTNYSNYFPANENLYEDTLKISFVNGSNIANLCKFC